MKPMNWIMLYLMINLIFFLMITLIYYMKKNNINNNLTSKNMMNYYNWFW